MSDRTKIEWTDATWNPITGCSIVSPGCTNCYAMKLAGTRLQHHPSRAGLTRETKAGPVWTGEVRLNEQWLTQPLSWRKPRMIFVCAHGDLFHESVPDEWIDRVFAVMALAPQHTFQVLTKRSARMRAYLAERGSRRRDRADAVNVAAANMIMEGLIAPCKAVAWPLPNVWLGVSAEDQRHADERVPDLLASPAAVRFVSAEPLLGPIDFRAIDIGGDEEVLPLGGTWLGRPEYEDEYGGQRLDWIIVGGESGRRPMHPDWARWIRDQCDGAGVPFFFKQWGTWAVSTIEAGGRLNPPLPVAGAKRWRRWDGMSFRSFGKDELVESFFAPGVIAAPVGKKAAGRLLDGREHNALPVRP